MTIINDDNNLMLLCKGEQGYRGLNAQLIIEDPYQFPHLLGNYVYEPENVAQFFDELHVSDNGCEFQQCGFRKLESTEFHTSAASCLDAALSSASQTQTMFYLYDSGEWKEGLHTKGDSELNLTSLPSFYGTSCSNAIKSSRPSLDSLCDFLNAPEYILELAVKSASEVAIDWRKSYEKHVAQEILCHWWNNNADEEYRQASNFALYCWDDKNRIWHSGDYEEPAWSMDSINKIPCKALFDFRGAKVVVVFLKSEFESVVTEADNWATNFRVDGQYWMKCGDAIEDLQTSLISMRSLQHLPTLIESTEKQS